MSEIQGIVVVHYDEDGEIGFRVFGDGKTRLFIVDERAPHDRVFEWTEREDMGAFRKLIPEGTEIGHGNDDRHAAISARVIAAASGKSHLNQVDTPHD